MPLQIAPVRTDSEWEQAKAVRTRVFIEEQACPPEEEWDAFDDASRHVLGYADGQVVATARWRTMPHDGRLVARLERFAVLPEFRGRGYGRALVAYLLEDARHAGFTTFVLHAQAHLEAFYESFGFRRTSNVFEEVGIPHVEMTLYEA